MLQRESLVHLSASPSLDIPWNLGSSMVMLKCRGFSSNGDELMSNNHQIDHSRLMALPGKKISLKAFSTKPIPELVEKSESKEALAEDATALAEAQRVLWASGQYAVLIILQGMDASGKDSTIRHVMSRVNPQGCDVHSFGPPTREELAHHFLWRASRDLPARGRIAIFNRSYYEEVLIVRVHPELLDVQRIPPGKRGKRFWRLRYKDIKHFEDALIRSGTCIIKFFLHISLEEQKSRFLKRLSNPEKHWKFTAADIHERSFWNGYRKAYEKMLRATSTTEAPWYIIPADEKWFSRACIADIITMHIEQLNLQYPKMTEEQMASLQEARALLESEEEQRTEEAKP